MNSTTDIPSEFLMPSDDWSYPDICITTKERFIRSISPNPLVDSNIIIAAIIAISMLYGSVKYGNLLSTAIFSFGTLYLIITHARKNIFYVPRYLLANYTRTLPRYEMNKNSISPRYYSEFNHAGNLKTFYCANIISANENDEFILEIDSSDMVRGCRKISRPIKPNSEISEPQ